MKITHTHLAILNLLYAAAAAGRRPSVMRIAHRLGISAPWAARQLRELEQRDLVDAERLSLTMQGLVLAVSTADKFAERRSAAA